MAVPRSPDKLRAWVGLTSPVSVPFSNFVDRFCNGAAAQRVRGTAADFAYLN
jgi:hypothetical protein